MRVYMTVTGEPKDFILYTKLDVLALLVIDFLPMNSTKNLKPNKSKLNIFTILLVFQYNNTISNKSL